MAQTVINVKAADLPAVRANVQALDIVIGLIADGYPAGMMSRYVRECVDMKLDGLLDAAALKGMRYLEKTMDGGAYLKLVDYLAEKMGTGNPGQAGAAEADAPEKPSEAAEAVTMEKKPGEAAEAVTLEKKPGEAAEAVTMEKKPGGAAEAVTLEKKAGAKTAARAAGAGKKAAAQTRKKAGAADGK